MGLNLELKAKLRHPDRGEMYTRRVGAEYVGILKQEDTYFQVPHGRLKLREIAAEGSELIYYEREEKSSERWSRYRTEKVHDPAVLKEMLSSALGVRVVIRKQRKLYLTPDARIHLDAVEGLGDFLEFEVTASDPKRAEAEMKRLRAAFEVESDEDVIRVSYSDMLLGKKFEGEA